MYFKFEHYKKKVNKKRILKDIIFIYLIAVIFVLLFNSMILQAYKIPSNSMEPQINEHYRILVNKYIYGPKYPFSEKKIFDATNNIRRGDVVVFMSNEYFRKNKFVRVISTLLYTLSFSIIDLSNHVYKEESNIYIKRVIGIPGDTIKYELVDGKVMVLINSIPERKIIGINYDLIEETERNSKLLSKMILINEYKVKGNEYYVLGDNRISSSDSRIWGGVNSRQMIGKAITIYYPFNKFGAIK